MKILLKVYRKLVNNIIYLKKHKKCPKTWKISRVCKFIKK